MGAQSSSSTVGGAAGANPTAASLVSLPVLPCDLSANTPKAVLGDWLDHIIAMFWPRVSPAIRKLLETEVFPNLPPSVAKYCKIKRFDLGSAGPSIKPLSVRQRTPGAVANSIIIDIRLVFDGEVDVVLDVGVCLLGVSSVNFKGTLTVVMSELIDEVPLVGAMQFFFEQPPDIDIVFAKAASLAEIPKIKNALFDGVQQMLRQYMVLPRALPAKLLPDRAIDLATLSYVEPIGVLRFQILAGRNLCRWGPKLGELKRLPSEVKVVVQCGGIKWVSDIKEGTGDVSWDNAEGAFLVSGVQQVVQIDVFDEHYLGGPLVKHMAKLRVSAKKILEFGHGWLELQDEKSRVGAECGTWQLEGEAAEPRALHVAVQWMPLADKNVASTDGSGTDAVLKDACGALQVRIGQIENLRVSGPVHARTILGNFNSETVQSTVEEEEEFGREEEQTQPEKPQRKEMPEDLQLVCRKLSDRGWSPTDIADLVEWKEDDVKFNIAETFEEEQTEINVDGSMLEAKPAKPTKKLIRHRIDDVVWLPVLHPPPFVIIEVLDESSNVVAQCKMHLPRSLLGGRQALMRMEPKGYVYASFQLRLYDETKHVYAQETSIPICEQEKCKLDDEKTAKDTKSKDTEKVAIDSKAKVTKEAAKASQKAVPDAESEVVTDDKAKG